MAETPLQPIGDMNPLVLVFPSESAYPFAAAGPVDGECLHTRVRTLVLLAAILAVAGGLRFCGLDREGRWGDEYYQTTSYDLPPWYVVLSARSSGQPPLDPLMGWAAGKISRSDWMRRAPAAFFGVLGVGLCYLLVRKMSSAPAGLLAAAILAFSPLHWRLSQTARPYTICVAAFMLMLWTLLRALEKPDRLRLGVYAAAAYVLTLTNGLAPPVIMLATGITLLGWLVSLRLWGGECRAETRRALGRVAAVTVAVGLAAVPMLLFLLNGAQSWTVFGTGEAGRAALQAPGFASRLTANVGIWFRGASELFGVQAWAVLLPALLGVGRCVRRWSVLPLPVCCICVIAWLVGPLCLLTFTATVPAAAIGSRYALFLVPLVAMFAAFGVEAVLDWFRGRVRGVPLPRMALAAAVVLLVLASPAYTAWRWSGRYFNADWRGCAAYLTDKVRAEDVIMVFQDRPLGKYQPPFWGKCEWSDGAERPLGEATWTLATSPAHWQRLTAKTGRCYLVIVYAVDRQAADDYLGQGLANSPPGMELVKFRGLDLLAPKHPPADVIAEQISACDTIMSLPKENPDSAAIALLLRSRLQLRRGEFAAAAESFAAAENLVPPRWREWFGDAAAAHRKALKAAVEHTPVAEPSGTDNTSKPPEPPITRT